MRAVFGLVLMIGVGLAGFAIFMVQGHFQTQRAELTQQRDMMQQAVPTVKVVAVNRTMKHGEAISKDDLVMIDYAEAHLPEGVFLTGAELFPDNTELMRTVIRQMEENEPILRVKVTEPGEAAGLTSVIARGMRAFAIRVDVSSGVSGFLSPGDRVDVYWTGNVSGITEGASGEITKLIQAAIPLVAIDQTSEQDGSGAMIARTVTVEVTPDQVAALAQAQATGSLSLSLVGRLDDTIAGAIEVSQASLLGLTGPAPRAEVQAEKVCTIRTRRGADVVEIPIPCTN